MSVVWTPGVSLEAIERQIIEEAYQFFRQNKSATASSLGIAVRTLDNKLNLYAESDKQGKDADEHRRNQREEFLRRSRGVHVDGGFDTAASIARMPNPTVGVEGLRYANALGGEADGAQADTGLRAQPAAVASEEPAVSVSKRSEVQAVLSKPTATHSNRGRR
jgi:hypothetical protein